MNSIIEFFQALGTNFALSTSLSYALGIAGAFIALLAIREVLSWFLKSSQIQAELIQVSEDLKSLHQKMDSLEELIKTEKPIKKEPSLSESPSAVLKKEFHLEENAPKEQFPL